MIHYHGTPIGGPRQDTARFLMGRHALVPFFRPDDLPAVMECCPSFCVDCSAWTIEQQGGKIEVPKYIEWCYGFHRHPGFDWALIPDVIGGTEATNDALIKLWPADIRGVPVWHMHESFERLVRLGNEWPIVALGSSAQFKSVGTQPWWNRMHRAMSHLCDSEGRPPCRLHGLRMLNPNVFRHLPLSSADSTNAAQNSGATARFGIYCPPTAWQRAAVIAERLESFNSAAVWSNVELTDELSFQQAI